MFNIRRDPFLLILIFLTAGLILFRLDTLKLLPSFINYKTLSVLIVFMFITKAIEFSGYLIYISDLFIKGAKTERGLVYSIIGFELLISPFITNDISLFLVVPLTLALRQRIKFDIEKLIIFEIWAANIGSSLLPIGNPQNIYIYQLYDIDLFTFIFKMVPFEIINISLIFFAIYIFFKKTPIKIKEFIPIAKNKRLFLLSIILFVIALVFIELRLYLTIFIITILIYFILDKKILYYGVNLNLLLIFIFLFIDIGIIKKISVISTFLGSLKNVYFSSLIFSQFISNVPSAILFSGFTNSYTPLLYGVNVAGNGTLISSLANLIGVRLGGVSVKRFHLYSLPFLIISTLLNYIYVRGL